RDAADVALPEAWRGRRVALRFETHCERPVPDGAVLPVFASPVLRSAGTKVRLAETSLEAPRLVADLIARFPEARAALEDEDDWEFVAHTTTREHCFAVRIDEGGVEQAPIPIVASGLTPALSTDERMRAERGGARPALFFQDDQELVRYPLESVPAGARLEFAIGIDHRCVEVGSAEFRIDLDGETVFRERLDPALRPGDRGWHERTVDLAPAAGRSAVLSFFGST